MKCFNWQIYEISMNASSQEMNQSMSLPSSSASLGVFYWFKTETIKKQKTKNKVDRRKQEDDDEYKKMCVWGRKRE